MNFITFIMGLFKLAQRQDIKTDLVFMHTVYALYKQIESDGKVDMNDTAAVINFVYDSLDAKFKFGGDPEKIKHAIWTGLLAFGAIKDAVAHLKQ